MSKENNEKNHVKLRDSWKAALDGHAKLTQEADQKAWEDMSSCLRTAIDKNGRSGNPSFAMRLKAEWQPFLVTKLLAELKNEHELPDVLLLDDLHENGDQRDGGIVGGVRRLLVAISEEVCSREFGTGKKSSVYWPYLMLVVVVS